ncbi:MAG: tRNA (adenosine(37)-N6)-threonylcarbamoyltransferase complex dimerization subunit type 1 TsaB [Gammaproteobacteria bacterium]
MKLLALDTATEACSAALYIDGEISQNYELAPREHTRLILAMIEGLLADAGISIQQLDALAFGRGPGSFTGVRIATGAVQGMAYGADLPVVPVSTLASIAQSVHDDHQADCVLTAIDARMEAVYWAEYQLDQGLMKLTGEERVISPEQVPVPTQQDWVAAGSGWAAYEQQLITRIQQPLHAIHSSYYPQSASIAKLAVHDFSQGQYVDAAHAMPVYLRNNVAKKTSER